MKKHQEIKRLLEKHLARKLSLDETELLFDRLRTVHTPEELDTYFRSHWDLNKFSESFTDLTWIEVLDDSNRRIALERKHTRHTRMRRMWQWSVAASVLFLISIVWWNWSADSDYVTYATNFGETKNIILDDGTSVILNANSELLWKNNWKKDNSRYAQLRGEAYFSVSHLDVKSGIATEESNSKDRMPFQVKTSDVVIDVLGTTFNVSERRGETQVYLEEGSVKLGLLENKISQNNVARGNSDTEENKVREPVKSLLMNPGESVQYSAETKRLQKNRSVESWALTEWKDGTLVYNNVLFGDMLDHLEDIYGKEFDVKDDNLLEKHVNFGVPYKNWEVVKNLMERTLGVDIVPGSDNKTIIIKRKE